jgi:hypothetical protein
MKIKIVLLFLSLFSCNGGFAGSYHVKVNGSPIGNGSISTPWDLQTALNQPSKVMGGDTIWVHKGIYSGVFISKLRGSSNAPIVVRAIPGERVIIDGKQPGLGQGNLAIEGQYAYYWGFEITNTVGVRVEGSGIMDVKDGVYIVGPYNKLINCIIHNNGNDGVGFWTPAIDSEIYGCIIYNNGYIGADRGHGHGIYSQNLNGTKTISDNILFNSFGLGIQIYTKNGSIQGYNIEGNIIFNSGLSGNDFFERHILVGGRQPADRILIKSNYLYNRPNFSSKAGIQLGFDAAENINAEVVDNYIVNGSFYVIKNWSNIRATGNTIATASTEKQLLSFEDFTTIQSPLYNKNHYYRGKLNRHTFEYWKNFGGQDNSSTYSPSLPSDTYYVLQKNKYEKGRAHLVVYNWGKESSINVDLTGVVEIDSQFEVYDVSNLSGGPINSGKFKGGKIKISMDLTKVELPFGNIPDKTKFIHTAPDFGVFLIKSSPNKRINSISEKNLSPIQITNYYPNPTTDILAIDFYSPDSKEMLISVKDTLGYVVKSELFEPKEGENKYILNLATFPSGNYFILISNENGSASVKVLKKKFIVNLNTKSRLRESPV